MTELDRAGLRLTTLASCARGRGSTIERQLHLIAAQSLLKAASDLAPSRSATDSGSVEGKLVGVAWRWVMAIHSTCVELGDLDWNRNLAIS